jgi:hypothetical protein
MTRIANCKLPALPFYLLMLAVLAGCGKSGPEVAPVSGRVTLDGKPIKFANVIFQVEGKSPGVGRTDDNGRYVLMYKRGVPGAPIGQNRVSIALDTELARGPQTVPARYNTETELEREVMPGDDNVFDFDLTTGKE